MKRIVLAVLFLFTACAAGAQMTCIEEGYDPLTGARGHGIPAFSSREGASATGADRTEPWWLEDPDRPALVQQR
jgi:hypothetical protein